MPLFLLSLWESVTELTFTGWGECTPHHDEIRIDLKSERGWSFLGTEAIGRNVTMLLNPFRGQENGVYTDRNGVRWDSERRYMLHVLTVHEFGHALGFQHEHARGNQR